MHGSIKSYYITIATDYNKFISNPEIINSYILCVRNANCAVSKSEGDLYILCKFLSLSRKFV